MHSDNRNLADERRLKKILDFIHKWKGLDLTSYRQNFLFRRLRLRLLNTKVKDELEYIALLEKGPEEFNLFLDALSINVTEFFRDPDVFSAFSRCALPELISRKDSLGNKTLRIWSSACANGEEAYSLAILIKEGLKERNDFLLRILATDIDNHALEKAKKGEYKAGELKNIDRQMLKKYFTPMDPVRDTKQLTGSAIVSNGVDDNYYRVNDQIRQAVKFQQHNLFNEPPFKCLDVIFCRNVLIYLNRQQIKELFNKFNRSLNPGGYLVLGKVENVWERDLFVPVELKTKIYQKAG